MSKNSPCHSRLGRQLLLSLLLPLVFGLTACANEPVPTVAPKSLLRGLRVTDGQVADPTLTPPGFRARTIAFCHSTALNEPAEIEVAAAANCSAPGERLEFFGQDRFLNPCPLFQPLRSSYLCFTPLVRPSG